MELSSGGGSCWCRGFGGIHGMLGGGPGHRWGKSHTDLHFFNTKITFPGIGIPVIKRRPWARLTIMIGICIIVKQHLSITTVLVLSPCRISSIVHCESCTMADNHLIDDHSSRRNNSCFSFAFHLFILYFPSDYACMTSYFQFSISLK